MERACELLTQRCKGLSSLNTIKRIISLGLLSKRKCIAFLVRMLVGELTASGSKKQSAIRIIADRFEVPEATIRTYIYHNTKD